MIERFLQKHNLFAESSSSPFMKTPLFSFDFHIFLALLRAGKKGLAGSPSSSDPDLFRSS